MKKNYFLTLLLSLFVSVVSFSQVILAENFTYADGSLVGNGAWAREGGTAGDFKVASGQAVVQHGTPSEDVKIAFTSVTGDVYVGFDFSVDDLGAPYSGSDNEYFTHLDFKARMDIVPPTGGGDFRVGISSSSSTAQATWGADLTFGTTYRAIIKFDQVTGTAQLWINPANSTDTSISGSADGAATVKEFELRQSDSSENETVRVDNLMIGKTFNDVLVFAAQTNPSLTVSSPSDNTEFNPSTTEVPVKFSISNFTLSKDNGSGGSDGSGQGYIKASLKKDGTPEPETKFFTDTPTPINVTAGSTYIATAELVDNNGNSLNPKVQTSVTFSVATYTDVTDLAALRAGTEGKYYKVTGGVAVSYVAGGSRNQIYMQDATGGILIDDPNGVITTSYNAGDGLSNIVGKLSSYGSVLQLVPTTDYGTAGSTGNSISTQTVTITDLNTNLNTYESEWVKITGVTFADADGTKVFEAGKNYNISDGTNTLVFRTNFSGADYIGQIIPTSTASITGIAAEFNGTSQIFATSTANIVLGVEKNNILGFTAYPNPVKNGRLTVTTSSVDSKEVTIYNVLGKRVFTQKFTGNTKQLDISNINSGIYIMKVIEGEKIATKKLVIK